MYWHLSVNDWQIPIAQKFLCIWHFRIWIEKIYFMIDNWFFVELCQFFHCRDIVVLSRQFGSHCRDVATIFLTTICLCLPLTWKENYSSCQRRNSLLHFFSWREKTRGIVMHFKWLLSIFPSQTANRTFSFSLFFPWLFPNCKIHTVQYK